MRSKIAKALSITFLFAFGVSFSQGVRGIVVDANTNEPLSFANVFINNSTIGTNCDESGKFVLKVIGPGEQELIVSFVGHQNYQTKFTITDTTTIYLTIKLVPLQIKEVEVSATRDKVWEKQFEKFKKLFIGEGFRDEEVRILNPAAINFNEDNDVFTVSASERLEIENYRLGYNIEYEMRTFLISPIAYNIVGYVRFKEMKTADPAVEKRWNENRFKAYRGSHRHLFKTIIDNQLEQSGFVLYEDISKGAPRTSNMLWANIDKFITRYKTDGTLSAEKDGTYKLKMPKRLEVHYKNKTAPAKYYKDASYPISWIETTTGFVQLDKSGSVLNYSAMVSSGQMTEQRVGEMLPKDYAPGLNDDGPVAATNSGNPYIHLLEKPYVQTDRSYYYHNDIVWFKAYMNYSNPNLRDSLSHVMYVELIGPDKKIVSQNTVRLNGGIGEGSIDLPVNLVPGFYQVRAYTHWQLNYSPSLIFARSIRLLGADEIVDHDGKYEVRQNGLLLMTDKEKYLSRDSVSVTINLSAPDELANISVSVTDITQGTPAPNELSITDVFPITISDITGLPRLPKYAVQDGVDIVGRLVDSKGASQQGVVTAMEKKSRMALNLPTGRSGDFVISNLDFVDSVELVFQGKLLSGKAGVVRLESFPTPAFQEIEKLQLKVLKNTNPSVRRWKPSPLEKIEMLPEVTVESQRIEDTRTPIKKMANYSISGEWFRKNGIRNIAVALQARVPGLNILTFMNGKALPYRVVMFQMRHKSFFPGGFSTNKEEQLERQEPLILIDDVVVNYQLGDGAYAIENLRPEEIERIDVYRSNAYGNYGPRGSNGVIAIYKRNPIEYAPARSSDSPVQRIKVAGFNSSRKFLGVKIPSDEPDNRATIFWSPTVDINGVNQTKVKFAAGDGPATYRVVAEGVTSVGVPVRGEALISVSGN